MRDRTRRAVQGELVEVAQALFVADGYEATTVDAIAVAAGMSRRTFFRYFASKEELVLGKYDLMGERLVEALRARPRDEPVWTSLRRMFDDVIAYTSDQARTPGLLEIERLVSSASALHAAYLGRLDAVQDRIAAVLHDRAASAGEGPAVDDPTLRALVGAAFACFTAARQAFLATGRPFAETTDQLMTAVRGPAVG